MESVDRGLLRLYGLASIEEATLDNWPWSHEDFPGARPGIWMPSIEPSAGLVDIVEKLREKGYHLTTGAKGYTIRMHNCRHTSEYHPTLAAAVRDALRFIGEE